MKRAHGPLLREDIVKLASALQCILDPDLREAIRLANRLQSFHLAVEKNCKTHQLMCNYRTLAECSRHIYRRPSTNR